MNWFKSGTEGSDPILDFYFLFFVGVIENREVAETGMWKHR